MQTWDLQALDVKAHQPEVIDSEDEGRVIVIELPAGEEMGDHQVYERAWLVVVSGRIAVTDSDGRAVEGNAGLLAEFDPRERHEVRALEDSRLLLLLSPWPGVGHPSAESPAEEPA